MIGVLGVATFTGQLARRTALLTVAAVPLPSFVINLGTPAVESALAAFAGHVLDAVGLGLEVAGPLLRSDGHRLELLQHDAGLPLAVVLGALGWYAALRRDRPPAQGLGHVGLGVLAAALLQPVSVVAAALLLRAGAPAAARVWLSYAAWGLLLIAGLLWVERRARGRG